ncbi:putative 3-oxo-5-alpha-steroid 4-dehydrogenase (NADP(+)) [Helianthus annuus]|uniref:3-oxo-5-alpha-steroid 4-dehydrogenase (NADP(+)) n=1 Tax=Helianthus annuus TaxID=4232 RepID=A0A251UEK8_HELAN|nr:very-long-chain enoyl-CoA reductase [Helianthus annuus]KAF5777799.1 putative 3-oxo-5-alpha-steroid 4-dehydrogenase (NADP(+)) [Helianthus annuus]KAJ0489286.1 putative 3-oxo-5-alpha-steroid 4-dehydrogenase (NADP(+)) [Helianthus annuus]KAJ0505165.1 putative 3-oxo-5-alpha-steroid 4-dehydrogenase (NADP(+)) [Helianthus annuus]KAJ0674850.1 putative 3-oxo-5-alpha-steroid 4-dehydrogenase (NADP(+)) [Helianthus annuus]KAJ0862569.1 putative 3-oxo-5-alpha-steroid 4-dehydrogenase (NADP(+)) [Helianthus an
MIPSVLQNFLFPPAPSLFVTTKLMIDISLLTCAGYMESTGRHMQYSKFLNQGLTKKESEMKFSSRTGMLLFYTPAFLVGMSSFVVFPEQDFRFVLLATALTVHFLKRVLEVLFLHKYSGSVGLESAIVVTLSYTLSTVTMLYAQYLSEDFPNPSVDLKYVGVGLFLTGIIGNFYHHYLLANLRKEGDKEYKIPQGGLFDLVICPHYLFEILGYVGISCISQTVYASVFTLGTMFYLMGRSHATREWYLSKFGDKFPKEVKAFIPYVF